MVAQRLVGHDLGRQPEPGRGCLDVVVQVEVPGGEVARPPGRQIEHHDVEQAADRGEPAQARGERPGQGQVRLGAGGHLAVHVAGQRLPRGRVRGDERGAERGLEARVRRQIVGSLPRGCRVAQAVEQATDRVDRVVRGQDRDPDLTPGSGPGGGRVRPELGQAGSGLRCCWAVSAGSKARAGSVSRMWVSAGPEAAAVVMCCSSAARRTAGGTPAVWCRL